MRRLPAYLIGALFLVCDLLLAWFVYSRLDPTGANGVLSRFNLAPQAASAPAPQPTRNPGPSLVSVPPRSRIFGVQGSSWNVDKWNPRTRVEMGVGDGFTLPAHSDSRRQYLILKVYEANRPGSFVHFASSARDFELRGSSRAIYNVARNFSTNSKTTRMRDFESLPPGGKNLGVVAFAIPVHSGTYMILWKESNAAGWVRVAQVAVGPGHRPRVSPFA